MTTNRKPPRVTLGSLATGVTVTAQYNPETLEEVLAVVYSKCKVQGLSHQVLQYEHTDNLSVKFDLAFDALSHEAYDVGQARKWLQSLCYSPKAGGAPPRVLFSWPGLFMLTSVVDKLTFKHKRFAWAGLLEPTWFVVSVALSEIRDTRITSEDVARDGTVRSSA